MLCAVTEPPVSRRGVARIVGFVLLPYLLLGLFWAGSNPPTAAPDEGDHLVKALGLARLDIGVPGPPAPEGTTDLGVVRNRSISRIVEIPVRLDPAGYPCFMFRTQVTAACQPASAPEAVGDVAAPTTLGAYPPFLYPPVGALATLGGNVTSAVLLGRLVVLAASMILLGLGCAHLVRWLGSRSLAGVALALTPMAVFCFGVLNTSAVEILGALGMAAVVTVYARHPGSLRDRRTLLVVLVCGTALVLSRQLGVVSMAALTVLLLALGGWREIWAGLSARSPMMWVTVAVPAVATLAVAVWELRYDQPALLGPWASLDSLRAFLLGQGPQLVQESVGWFGWLDVRPPPVVNLAWVVAVAALVGAALVVGDRRDRLVIVGMAAVGVLVSYVTYSRAFYGIGAGLQGRHVLPILAIVPLWSGAVLARQRPPRVWRPVVAVAAGTLSAVVAVGLYDNAKRYAVGLGPGSGERWFLPVAQWSPVGGWALWMAVGLAGAVLLGAGWWRTLTRS